VGDGVSAAVSWTQSANGNSPITSSTIHANAPAGAPLVPNTVVTGAATGGTVHGLTCGNSYTFQVFATNAAGSGTLSTASLPVAIPCVTSADVSLTMTSPATINPGSILTYNVSVHNGGPAPAAQVMIADTLPAPFLSATSSQGVCGGAVGVTTMTCNLGALPAGSTATYSVSVQLPTLQTTGSFTNTATATVTDAGGNNVDPNLANNSASATTTVQQTQTCNSTTTDLQVVGSAQNGGPAVGSGDTFTWQIKNNLGTTPANCAVFTSTMPSNFTINSVTGTGCSASGHAITCNLGTVNGGTTSIVTVNFNVGPTAGTFSTTGLASFSGTDTNSGNNQFTVTIQPK
jgi:uncharacterized repeat protein (TIGR01451 family)